MSAITTKLGTRCFMSNPKLKTVKISANVTELGTDCFRSNEALTDIIFDAPENLQYIRSYCFGSDASLKSPFSCKNIIQIGDPNDTGSIAFDSCKIPYMDFRGRTLDYLPEIGTDEFYIMSDLKIIVDEDKYDDWVNTYGDRCWGPQICVDENGNKPQLINRDDYLTITALEDNVSIGFTREYPLSTPNIQYNLTGRNTGWLNFPTDGEGITLSNSGDRISFKGVHPSGLKIGQFNLPDKCNLSGNTDSLLSAVQSQSDLNSIYKGLFKDCEGIINAKDLSFGASVEASVGIDTFREMFKGCTNLISAPELICGTAEQGTFFGLFDGCTNLNKIVLNSTYSYDYSVGGVYTVSVDENTLPDLSSKDEPGYLYVNGGNFYVYNHNEGKVNILEYAQSHNWVPLTKYPDIRYWNKDKIGDRVSIRYGGKLYDIGGTIGTGMQTEYIFASPYVSPYICNIFTAPKVEGYYDYNWELVGRNIALDSSMTIQEILDSEGITYDKNNQRIQVIIMGTRDYK